MSLILDSVMLATVEDETRFRQIIDAMIKKKDVKKFKVILLLYFFYLIKKKQSERHCYFQYSFSL